MKRDLPNVGGCAYTAACPDCPGSRLGVLRSIVGEAKSECHFAGHSVEARAPLPAWDAELVWVRRGVIIRERMSTDGTTTAIDAAGPGSVFPVDPSTTGYAATATLVCLLREGGVDEAVRQGEASDVLELHRAALTRVERLAHARGASTARSKVARLLVVLAETLSPPRVRDDLPDGFQQRDLSRLLGIRHETLCRAVGKLESEGRLRRGPTGTICELDLDALREI